MDKSFHTYYEVSCTGQLAGGQRPDEEIMDPANPFQPHQISSDQGTVHMQRDAWRKMSGQEQGKEKASDKSDTYIRS